MVQGSGKKKKAYSRKPKHQNVFKFKHNKNSKKTKKIYATPIQGVCKKCFDIIQWRKDYRRYKPLTQPKKCLQCSERKIVHAYHTLCQDCATEKNVCAKCREDHKIIVTTKQREAIEEEKEQAFMRSLQGLSEAERKTKMRNYIKEMCEEEEEKRKRKQRHDDDDEEDDGEHEDDDYDEKDDASTSNTTTEEKDTNEDTSSNKPEESKLEDMVDKLLDI